MDMAEREAVADIQSMKGNRESDMPIDFGFNFPHNLEDIRRDVFVLKNYGMWPEPGGINDQNAKWVDDMLTYTKIKNYYYDINRPKGDGK